MKYHPVLDILFVQVRGLCLILNKTTCCTFLSPDFNTTKSLIKKVADTNTSLDLTTR